MKLRFLCCFVLLLALPALAVTKKATSPESPKSAYSEKTFSGLELRDIGPAMTSGRIVDLAVDPRDSRTWFIASASGGVWKTTNAGTTFTPVFGLMVRIAFHVLPPSAVL